MQAAINQFQDNFMAIVELKNLHLTLTTQNLHSDLTDLLRFQLVYAISAFDKLIHELVKFGMKECFLNQREKTSNFKTFKISADSLASITQAELAQQHSLQTGAIILPNQLPEYFFELEINIQGKNASYQNSKNLMTGLNLFWNANDKWKLIAKKMYDDENKQSDIITQLNNIADKRNLIVHEADINPTTNQKTIHSPQDIADEVDFIKKLGESIYSCVKL